jgi:hypothetical protein
MKNLQVVFGLLTVALTLGKQANAQLPSGSDINSAIPIYYQQVVNDLGDVNTAPLRVYSITVSKNQQIAAALSNANTAPAAKLQLSIWAPTTTTLAGCNYSCSDAAALQSTFTGGGHGIALNFTASVSGVYYILVAFGSQSVNYTLEVTTPTLPASSPNCSGGNLAGQVDYVTYSLTLIGAGLPDSASVGGTQLCATCTIKAPGYPQIAEKMESAMGLNVPVSLCYDGSGNINQITLKHP